MKRHCEKEHFQIEIKWRKYKSELDLKGIKQKDPMQKSQEYDSSENDKIQAQAYYNLGKSLDKLKCPDEAIDNMQKAVTILELQKPPSTALIETIGKFYK